MTSPWMNVEEMAEYLKTTPEGIYKQVQRGQLPAHRQGKRLLFHREEIDRHLLNQGPI